MPQLFKSVTEAPGISRGPVSFNEPGHYRIDTSVSRAAVHTREELLSHDSLSGFMARQKNDPRRVAEAARLMADVISGREDPMIFKEAMFPTKEYVVRHIMETYPGIYTNAYGDRIGLRETMSYSDYSALTVDILDRAFYGYYTAAPITNMPLVKQVSLRDFRLVARYAMDGAVSPWTALASTAGSNFFVPPAQPHAPGEPPTERSMVQAAREVLGSTQRVTYQPQLYQAMMSVNWRALVNDDLGIFKDLTNRLAIGGRRTIYQFITGLYSSSTGPNSTLFNATFANQILASLGAHINNPVLDFQGLQDGMVVLAKQKDIEGQPITFEGTLYLVYGPALTTVAQNLKRAVQADISILGGTQNTQGFPTQRLRMDNWVAGNLVLIEDKYLPIVTNNGSGTTADQQWYLFYDPNAQERPAIELGFLRGFEAPQMFQKVPTTMRVGGAVDPMMGDFKTMDQDFKGVTVFGGTQIDGRSCVASTGQQA